MAMSRTVAPRPAWVMKQIMARVLYFSYDGMLEPLGQSQVIAYLEKLSGAHEIRIVSFEKPADLAEADKVEAIRERLAAAKIGWTPLRYHKAPSAPATVYDIGQGIARSLPALLAWRPDILHCRSYIAAAIALVLTRVTRAKFLFDIRGFWPDERVDGGLWPADGSVYRAVKALEKRLFAAADHVVTLTDTSVPIIAGFYLDGVARPPVTVIPTCADLDRFSLGERPAAEPFTFGYVGSFGTWYLIDETMALFAAVRCQRPDARFLIVNRNEHEIVRAAAIRAGIPDDAIELTAASHAAMPALIRRMHAGAALIRPCFSKLSSAPTKLAEYLGCGVPCVGNTGVGDMEDILEGDGAGVALRSFDDAALDDAATRILAIAADPATPARCRTIAEGRFSLESGVEAYDAIYRSLSGTGAARIGGEG